MHVRSFASFGRLYGRQDLRVFHLCFSLLSFNTNNAFFSHTSFLGRAKVVSYSEVVVVAPATTTYASKRERERERTRPRATHTERVKKARAKSD